MKATDFQKFDIIAEDLILADRRNPDDKKLVHVKVYRDLSTQRAYQVDFRNHEYREAAHVLGNYGEWKKFDK